MTAVHLQSLIVEQLTRGEMGALSLVVAVRRAQGPSVRSKGDLGALVKSALKSLVASKTIVDHDGRYSLSPAQK